MLSDAGAVSREQHLNAYSNLSEGLPSKDVLEVVDWSYDSVQGLGEENYRNSFCRHSLAECVRVIRRIIVKGSSKDRISYAAILATLAQQSRRSDRQHSRLPKLRRCYLC